MELATGVLETRLATAGRYFRALRQALGSEWSVLHDRFQSGDLVFPETLVLIHPMWLEGINAYAPNRRHRSFNLRAPAFESCASNLVWGYSCPFPRDLETDHLFPWGLGGPTRSENAVYLCVNHNRAKGHDVHLIPWEKPSQHFSWLPDEIAEVEKLLAAN